MLQKSSIRWFYAWGGRGAPVAVREGNIFHHSLREWSPSFCGRRQGTVSCPSGTTKGRSSSGGFALALWKPSPDRSSNYRCPMSAGRGGSVSRRDHNQAYRRRAHSQAEPTPKKHSPQTPAVLREGVRGRCFLQRSSLPRRSPPLRYFFGREREGGAS